MVKTASIPQLDGASLYILLVVVIPSPGVQSLAEVFGLCMVSKERGTLNSGTPRIPKSRGTLIVHWGLPERQ